MYQSTHVGLVSTLRGTYIKRGARGSSRRGIMVNFYAQTCAFSASIYGENDFLYVKENTKFITFFRPSTFF